MCSNYTQADVFKHLFPLIRMILCLQPMKTHLTLEYYVNKKEKKKKYGLIEKCNTCLNIMF